MHALALISILFANIVWSAIYLYKVSRFVEPLPDWLMKQFGYAAIYEEKDIQFVIITGANEITDENQYSFCYILQNCSNAERVVQVKINVEKNWSFSSKGLIVPSEIQQIELLEKMIKHSYSVRKVEDEVRKLLSPKKKAKIVSLPTTGRISDASKKDLEEKMQRILGTKVMFKQDKNGAGEIVIEFYSTAELERLYELLESIGRGYN